MTDAAPFSDPQPNDGRDRLMAGLSLLLLWLLVFLPAVGNGFVDWDDGELIYGNGMLRPGGWPLVAGAWRAPAFGLYTPLTFTVQATIAAAARAAGLAMRPEAFHAVSVLVHGLGALLVWRLLKLLCGHEWAAAVGAAVWLVHPLQTETVAWASGFNGVLGGTLAVLALLLEVRAVTRTAGRGPWLVLAGMAVAASLLAKPAGVLLPVAVVGINGFVLRRPWKETLLLAGACLLIVAPFAWVGRTAQSGSAMEPASPLVRRPLVALHAAGFYLIKGAWPIGLTVDYALPPAIVLNERLWILPAGIFLLACVTAALLYWKRRTWAVGGLLVFLAGTGPVLGLVPFYFQNYSTVADRYAYFPMLGLAVVMAMALGPMRRPASRAIAAGVVLALAGLTMRQVSFWHDTATLFTHAYAVNPAGIAASGHVGMLAQQHGNLPLAEQAYRAALGRRPWDAGMRSRLAQVLAATGRPGEAAAEFARIAAESPDDAAALTNLGIACVAAGRDADAREAFARAVRLDPRSAPAYARLGATLQRLGDPAHARAAFAAALRIDPTQPLARRGLAALDAAAPAATRPGR